MQTASRTTTEKTTKQLIEEGLSKGIAYDGYRKRVAQLADEGKSTGPEQTEALSNYTVLNDRRMKRFDKTLKIDSETVSRIEAMSDPVTMLVLTESWCGDAAPTIPVMNKIAQLNANIELKIILRDENLALMDRFLTEGAMSIPKLIFLDAQNEPFATWGPRPEPAAKLVRDHKQKHGRLLPEIREEIQLWYNKDKGQTTVRELVDLLPM
ncbi:MAG: thioredoxin family protein [Pricia sp.]